MLSVKKGEPRWAVLSGIGVQAGSAKQPPLLFGSPGGWPEGPPGSVSPGGSNAFSGECAQRCPRVVPVVGGARGASGSTEGGRFEFSRPGPRLLVHRGLSRKSRRGSEPGRCRASNPGPARCQPLGWGCGPRNKEGPTRASEVLGCRHSGSLWDLGASCLLGDRIGPEHGGRGPQKAQHTQKHPPPYQTGLSVGVWELGAGWHSPRSLCGELGALQGSGWRELSGAAWRRWCGVSHVECGSRARASVASHLEAAPAASSPAHLSE